MISRIISAWACVIFICSPGFAQDSDPRVFELRVYTANPGKLDGLNARFRDHTAKLFEKHKITNVGYFTPIENNANKLYYILSYPSLEARDASWKAFTADPAWRAAYKESEKNGALMAKSERFMMKPTDYSPTIQVEKLGDRVFELRTYTAAPGRLDALNSRFRDHTVKLFAKHGMSNIGYWTLMKDQKDSDVSLIYLLAHKSVDAAKKSFDSFRQDPDWSKARTGSESKAGGPLTVKDGVKSVFLTPTDYSPMK